MLKIEIHEFASSEFDEAIQWYENQVKGLGACPRIENLLRKSWIWPYFPLILVKYTYIRLKLVENLTQTSFLSLRFLFSDKLLGERFKKAVVNRIKFARKNPSWYPQESQNIYKFYIPKFPYKVLFTFNQTHLIIWAICHLHRKPRYWESRINN